MGDDSLLDQLLQDHEVRQQEVPKKRAAERGMARALDEARQSSKAEARKAEWKAAEDRTRRRVAGAAPELAGFREGQRFELKGGRPELRGTWVVVRVEPGAAGDPARRMYAQRAAGGEGFLPLTEKQAQDLLYARILSRLD